MALVRVIYNLRNEEADFPTKVFFGKARFHAVVDSDFVRLCSSFQLDQKHNEMSHSAEKKCRARFLRYAFDIHIEF